MEEAYPKIKDIPITEAFKSIELGVTAKHQKAGCKLAAGFLVFIVNHLCSTLYIER